MHSAKQKIIQFCHQFKLENLSYSLVLLIIGAILFFATFAFYRPISLAQFRHVQQLAQQAYYPSTQEMATQLIQHQQLTIGQYLKLMRAYHTEQSRAQELPPLEDESLRHR